MSGLDDRTRCASACEQEAALERALGNTFWRSVQQHPLPVMAALEVAARTIGTLYRQVAAAHGVGGSCGCGWQPDPDSDVLVLEAMLAAAAQPRKPHDDLANLPAAGHA